MNVSRLIVTSAALVAVIYAVGQGTSNSTSTSQSRNGGASASASSSASSVGRGQGGGQTFGGPIGVGGAKPNYVVTYKFQDRAPTGNVAVRDFDANLFERENQFWSRLAQGGKLVMAGYWREKDGAMAVLSAKDDREVMQLLQSDPAIKQGASFEVRAWDVSVTNLSFPPAIAPSLINRSENSNSQTTSQRTSSSGGR